MRIGKSQNIVVYYDDYLILKERLIKRPGLKMPGLIHELLIKTEPLPRTQDGKFTHKEND